MRHTHGPKPSSASAAIRKIASLGFRPINDPAAHGIHGSTMPFTYIPEGGIDCRKWSQVKLERFFRERYPWLGLDSVRRLVVVARQDGRIEAKPLVKAPWRCR